MPRRGNNLSAQGNALGMQEAQSSPCKGKRMTSAGVLLPLQGVRSQPRYPVPRRGAISIIPHQAAGAVWGSVSPHHTRHLVEVRPCITPYQLLAGAVPHKPHTSVAPRRGAISITPHKPLFLLRYAIESPLDFLHCVGYLYSTPPVCRRHATYTCRVVVACLRHACPCVGERPHTALALSVGLMG